MLVLPGRGRSSQHQSCDLFHLRECHFVFRKCLPVLLVELENVEKRCEERLKILPIRLISRQARPQFGVSLRDEAFAIELQELRRLLPSQELLPQFESDLLRSSFVFALRAALVRFRLSKLRLLPPTAIDREANAKRNHVVRAELCRVRALPQVLDVEVRIEVFLCQIHLELLSLRRFLCGREFGVIPVRRSEQLLVAVRSRSL